jgi:hypothetical protein
MEVVSVEYTILIYVSFLLKKKFAAQSIFVFMNIEECSIWLFVL